MVGSSCFEEKLSGSHHLKAGSKKHRNRLQGQCLSSGPNHVVHLLAWHYQRCGPNSGGVYHLGTWTIENENETLYKRYMNPQKMKMTNKSNDFWLRASSHRPPGDKSTTSTHFIPFNWHSMISHMTTSRTDFLMQALLSVTKLYS